MINGKLLRDGLISAAVSIQNARKEVDRLNVYPVPDGDTGTNMSLTINAAAKELELLEDNVSVSKVADTAASAMLRGARGNSGVILSLIFRGFSKTLSGLETAECLNIAHALSAGVEGAYNAVMNPTEGTILTVSRAASEKASEIAEKSNDIAEFWEQVCTSANEVLEKTPEQLPVLKKAGVVDAGGKGLVIIFDAMLKIFKGGKIEDSTEKKEVSKTFEVSQPDNDEEIKYSYCTEYIIERYNDVDPFMLRAYLETIGDCVVVVDDEEIIKVHVHTDNPGLAIQKALEFGRFINDPKPKIENMRIQHEMRIKDEKIAKRQNFMPTKPEKEFGFVAVAAGHGLGELFKDLGADCVIMGGQTMNPSTDDILKAIHSTPASTVFVLPNNKNIIMAAEQTKNLADRNVCVLPTRTIPQGISAMMTFDETIGFSENRLAMTKAFESVSTGQITFAARDSEYEGHNIKSGEILAFDNNKLMFTEKDLTKAAFKLIKKMVGGDSNYVTVYYGADVTKEQAEKLEEMLNSKIGNKVDVMMVNGGQPVYYYIISVE
ncbi:MAG: DAK2 domain-containing protein [Clostridium sp.]|nr:DAK2 domain-containing protein [Clostridium sp.]MCM1547488.1 DAK2 domain-containing protein [Ruminococcus sp.]